MTNSRDLTIKWIKLKKIKEPNWGKTTGIMQNLLKRYNSDEIKNAIEIYVKHYKFYPYCEIEGFWNYCPRIIKNERNKQRRNK